ncbi:hypothetical protein SRB5_18800 [Streptomyces sp. RB5]|uniref:ABC transmembrane type-1 domain-containing protein n=1 Tax=Streptomyces smaragdinus TaxID=2585196 RepID=A0A7K0CE72_9ACTN|nr:ABC transporter permease [Streptomyces smaragdinus]MQY11761.1 hypothetical protein [Streptomyces smaragdinus]
MRRLTSVAHRLLGLLVFAVLVAAWWLGSQNSLNPFYPPLEVITQHFRDNWLFERVPGDLVPSMWRLAVGYLIGVAAGAGLGMLIGVRPRLRRAVTPVIDFMRSLPPTALIPTAIVVIGIGSSGKVGLIALACVWPVLLNTVTAVANLDVIWSQTAKAYRISGWRYLRRVQLPGALPQILAGARAALAVALIMVVVTEMVGSTEGIGHFVIQAQRTFALADMWSGVLLIGLIGFAINALFVAVQRGLLRSHGPRGTTRS